MKWDVGYLKEQLVEYRIHDEGYSSQMIKDKSIIMCFHLCKTMILNVHLPDDKKHLRSLYPKMTERVAHHCQNHYAVNALISGENDVCLEYLHLAVSFHLGIQDTPRFQFLESASTKKGWTAETLKEEWKKNRA